MRKSWYIIIIIIIIKGEIDVIIEGKLKVYGASSQLDLPSLTPLSVAGCGRLQLGIPHWATSVITASS